MYSLGAILDKNPSEIAGAVRSVLYVAVLAGLVVVDEKLLAATALGLEIVLGLFVRAKTTPTAAPQLRVGTEANAGSAVVASKDPPPEPTAAVPEGRP